MVTAGIILVAFAVITLSFSPALLEARAGRPARRWALAGLSGPQVFVVWLFIRLRARFAFAAPGPPRWLFPWWARRPLVSRQSSGAARLMKRPDDLV